MELLYRDRISHPKAAEYTVLTSTHGPFPRVGHMVTIKQVSVYLRSFESYEASFLTTKL